MTPSKLIHGSVAVLGTKGVLVQGASGSGKSTLVLALLAECKKRGSFGQLVGDDQVRSLVVGGVLIAEAMPAIAGRIEQAFNGIVDCPHMSSARIDLIAHLASVDALERMPDTKADAQFPEVALIDVPERQTAISVPLILSRLGLD